LHHSWVTRDLGWTKCSIRSAPFDAVPALMHHTPYFVLVDWSNNRRRRSGAYVRTPNKNTRQFDPGNTTNSDLNWQSDVLQRKWATSPLGSSSFSTSFSHNWEKTEDYVRRTWQHFNFRHKDRRSGAECQPTATPPPLYHFNFRINSHCIRSREITGFRTAGGDGWDKTKDKIKVPTGFGCVALALLTVFRRTCIGVSLSCSASG
jgi:hypothetical protein